MSLGVSFAEYDDTLKDPWVFVQTPAALAASDPARQKYFFVGRRGTGKTATAFHLQRNDHHADHIHPGIFSPIQPQFAHADFADPRQKPYRSLLAAFRLTLQEELLAMQSRCCGVSPGSMPSGLQPVATWGLNKEFDSRLLEHIDDYLGALSQGNDSEWLYAIGASKRVDRSAEASRVTKGPSHTILVDRLDEYWDGSDLAVAYLSALMHAALQINTQTRLGRVLIFLRENIFERVRSMDPEFARLETSVVGLDWTLEQLVELVERRLNRPLNTRLALGGETWSAFFGGGSASIAAVLDYCQGRPRDVLTYCGLAVETAVSRRHERIEMDDLISARRRFSDSRLKDLGDEYSENYPQIAAVLSRFYGLSRRFTVRAAEDLLGHLLEDAEIRRGCASWIFSNSTPELFIRLLYNIGFVGLATGSSTAYRSSGPRDTTPPPISSAAHIVVHPSYWDALDLREGLLTELDESRPYLRVGLVAELPEAISFGEYLDQLLELEERLDALPLGNDDASRYEDIVGDVIRLCFHRSLTNVEARSRSADGRVIRDWVASNRADTGFWEMVRVRYDAMQIIWECKNYTKLSAEDFHQLAYYLTKPIGRFGVVAFRGDASTGLQGEAKRYADHLRRIAVEKDGLVLLVNDSDLKVFIRQARNGKIKDAHMQDRYDQVVRLIS